MEKQVIFFGACHYSGLIGLARWWMRRRGPRLIILNYHRASGGDLRRHLLYLKRHYRMMHLEAALEELYAPPKPEKRDRRTPLVLTFDDGYRDNYTYGFPLVCELKVPITIFLIPGYIENRNCFWWQAGERIARTACVDEMELDGHIYHLDRPGERQAFAQIIYTHVCNASSVAERERFLEGVSARCGLPATVLREEETALRWSEIREMEASGRVSFGAHTMHHPVLGYLADACEVQHEVSECRTVLEQQLGHPVSTFAYPLGRAEHIGPQAPRAVEEAGYSYAVTTIYGFNTPESEPRQLHRIVGDVKQHWLLLAADICGLRRFFMPLFPYGRKILAVFRGGNATS